MDNDECMSYIATCRSCGAKGIETPDDPCPGLCPGCFEIALQELGAGLHSGAIRTPDEIADALTTIGVTQEYVSPYRLSLTIKASRHHDR